MYISRAKGLTYCVRHSSAAGFEIAITLGVYCLLGYYSVYSVDR